MNGNVKLGGVRRLAVANGPNIFQMLLVRLVETRLQSAATILPRYREIFNETFNENFHENLVRFLDILVTFLETENFPSLLGSTCVVLRTDDHEVKWRRWKGRQAGMSQVLRRLDDGISSLVAVSSGATSSTSSVGLDGRFWTISISGTPTAV